MTNESIVSFFAAEISTELTSNGLTPSDLQVSLKYKSVTVFNSTGDFDHEILKVHIAADLDIESHLIIVSVIPNGRRHLLDTSHLIFSASLISDTSHIADLRRTSLTSSVASFLQNGYGGSAQSSFVQPIIQVQATYTDANAETNNAAIEAQNSNVVLEDMQLALSSEVDPADVGVFNDAEQILVVYAPPPPPPDAPPAPQLGLLASSVSYRIQNGRFVTVVPTVPTDREESLNFCTTEYGGTLAVLETATDFYHVRQTLTDSRLASDNHTKFWMGGQKICVGTNADVCLWKWDRGGLIGNHYRFQAWVNEGETNEKCSYLTDAGWFGTICDDADVGAFVCDLTTPPSPPPPFAFGAAPPPPQFVRDDHFICPNPSVDTTTENGVIRISITFFRSNETITPVTSWTFDPDRVSSDAENYFPLGQHSDQMFHAVDFEGVCVQEDGVSFNGTRHDVPLCGSTHFWEVTHFFDDTQSRCPHKYVAQNSQRYGELRALQLDDGTPAITHDGTLYNFKLTWTIFVMEFALIDSSTITQRVTPFQNDIDIAETVSVSILIDGGILSPDVLVEMRSLFAQRSSESNAVVTFGISGYVRQTLTEQRIHIGDINRPTFTGANVDSVSCENVLFSIREYNIDFDDLPMSIQRRTIDSGDIKWIRYDIDSTCDVSFTAENTLTGYNIRVPSLDFSYQLQANSTDSSEFKDVGSGGTFSFEISFMVEPPQESTILLEIDGMLKTLPENKISAVENGTLAIEDMVSEAVEKTTNSVAWSERIAFHVRLSDPEQRYRMRLVPIFLMFTAHVGSDSVFTTGEFAYDHVTQNNKKNETFCGISTATAAAILEIDNDKLTWATNNLNTLLSGVEVMSTNDIAAFTGINAQTSFAVNDTSGGFAIPVRNTLRLPSGQAGGFSIQMCAVTELVPMPFFPNGTNSSGSVFPGRRLAAIETAPFTYISADAAPPHSQSMSLYLQPPQRSHVILGDEHMIASVNGVNNVRITETHNRDRYFISDVEILIFFMLGIIGAIVIGVIIMAPLLCQSRSTIKMQSKLPV